MAHLFNIFYTFWICIILRLFLFLFGLIILPIAVLFRLPNRNLNQESNQERFKWKWIDKIYGNVYDGFGDSPYKRDHPKDTYFSRLWWCAIRNPTHNFLIRKGVFNAYICNSIIDGNPIVTDDPYLKNMGLKIQAVSDLEDNVYTMYYYCIMWSQLNPFKTTIYDGTPKRGIRVLIGYKNFAIDKGTNRRYTYGMTFAINPIKLFVKG